jgi:8-oxo-dGTP diphosphatase
VLGTSRTADERAYYARVTGSGLSVPTGETTTRDGGRPAQLFRAGTARALHPPLVR